VGSQTGLLRFDGLKFDSFNVEYDNNANHIRSLTIDREDNLWLGTHNGLFRYRDNSFTTYDKVNGLGNSFISQIFRDNRGDLWVCSENNGIYHQNQNYFKRYDTRFGLKSLTCRSGIQTESGRLLFGTENGVFEFVQERFVQIPLDSRLAGPYDVVYQATNKTIWIGGTSGVAALRWEGGRPVSRFYPIRSRFDFGVFGFCEDNQHNLYVGTFKAGLYKLEGDSLVNLSSKLGLNEETFFSIRYHAGKIFGASLSGLLVLDLDSGKIKRITEADGLNSDLVYSVELTDNKKYLWVGTNQGINRLNLEKYLLSGVADINSYGKNEGFGGVECNVNGIWQDKDQTLWFGTVSGLIRYQPFNYKTNIQETKTVIQRIKLRNEDTLLANNVGTVHAVLPVLFVIANSVAKTN